MWLSKLFKKEISPASFSWLGADMHSHLIPGIDDGSPDLATSVELVKGFIEMGYQKIITTPHILWEMYPNTPERIEAGLTELRKELINQNIHIEIEAAAEYFIDEHFVKELGNKQKLLTLKDNLVLVEISTFSAPFDFQEVLFELQLQGYQPVIAHPERYIYLRNNKEIFETLKNAGYYFQLNLLSLIGHYGLSVQELAEHLAKNSFYEFAGTDVHNAKHMKLLQKVALSPALQRIKDSGQNRNIDLL